MDLTRAIAHELPSHQRLVVGVGKSKVAAFACDLKRNVGEFDRSGDLAGYAVLAALRYRVVLAERTLEVAPEAAHGKHLFAGMEKRDRFLLDWIERERRDLAVVRRNHASAFRLPRTAKSERALVERAMPRTCPANHSCSIHGSDGAETPTTTLTNVPAADGTVIVAFFPSPEKVVPWTVLSTRFVTVSPAAT